MFTFQQDNTKSQTLLAPHCCNGSCRYARAQGTRMGADKLAETTPNATKILQPNLPALGQKFDIFKIKTLWVSDTVDKANLGSNFLTL